MKKSLRLVLSLLSSLALFFAIARPAFACSGGGDDPVALSEVIVGGWITDWKPANSGPTDQVEPVMIQISVDRVFKGTIRNQTTLQFINYQMLDYSHQAIGWDGGLVGSCSAFELDPKGKYVIIGVVKNEAGQYQTDLFYRFYLGDKPPTENAFATSSRLAELIPFLPVSGGENQSPSGALLIAGSTLLLAGILTRRRANAKTERRQTSTS